ncbi:eCIS core domain-containing protein [Kitasatospora cathayae]|uniref:DUF4157 domain-containing protein n=1 Tax=Kitasatospora cathayae TaxID=3004092 RepID=A0ABY7QE09_9ACTN|nr:DUF4157 domain-containing protein [Kitasatospora sp. HUAS 3-15]WBP91005.1 DUF4157 domain-containing protein [Kitasatospora sp. HUAS 3-15]
MRTRDGERHRDNRDTVADRTARAGRAPAHRLLALQTSVGNAAVVQMLHRGGHLTEHQASGPLAAVQRSTVDDVLRTAGRPLKEATRTEMEARLGADFSDVRVHDGPAARASAAEVGARAYTSGNHVVIGEGGGDKHTLAHELTHVIQQRHGPVAGTDNGSGLRISDPSDRFEREAQATAQRVMTGPVRSPESPEERGHTVPQQRSAHSTAADALQRAASDDLPEADTPSQAVPELPAALVEQLQQAKAESGTDSKAVRQAALDTLLRYVLAQLPVTPDHPELQTALADKNLVLSYKHSRQGAGKPMALTSTGTSGDRVTMALYRNLFDDYGPAEIHSTLRHELIHAAQAMLMPDEDAADGADPHIYMDVLSDIGHETFATLQQPMREIETHVWELEHAGRTGISSGYLGETVGYLVQYTDELVGNLGRTTTTDRHLDYWRAYLENSVAALGRAAATPAVAGHTDQALAGQITGAQQRLQGAIHAREQASASAGKRPGGTGRGSTSTRKRGKTDQ